MSKDEKIYLVAFVYCTAAYASTHGVTAFVFGLLLVLAGYNFVSAQHSVQRTADGLPQPTPDNQMTEERQRDTNSRRR